MHSLRGVIRASNQWIVGVSDISRALMPCPWPPVVWNKFVRHPQQERGKNSDCTGLKSCNHDVTYFFASPVMAKSSKREKAPKKNTSLRLDAAMLKQLKRRAVEEETSIQRIIETLIRDYLGSK